MTPSLDELLLNLYRVAQEHHRAGALYYASLEKSDKVTRDKAAEPYKLSGENYQAALGECERHLLSMPRDEEMERELQRIQNLIHSVGVVLKYL